MWNIQERIDENRSSSNNSSNLSPKEAFVNGNGQGLLSKWRQRLQDNDQEQNPNSHFMPYQNQWTPERNNVVQAAKWRIYAGANIIKKTIVESPALKEWSGQSDRSFSEIGNPKLSSTKKTL